MSTASPELSFPNGMAGSITDLAVVESFRLHARRPRRKVVPKVVLSLVRRQLTEE
jgi:hypothetical protein